MVRRLLYLNGISIINVVLFHAVGMGFVAMFAWAHRYLPPNTSPSDQIGSFWYYVLRFFEQLVVFCIPAFLFVSGYFVAVATGKSRVTVGWDFVFNRIKTLLIPYLIWSFVVLFLLFLQGREPSLKKVLIDLLTGSSNEVLYYIPLLIQFYLLAPLFVRLARKNWKLFLFGAALIQLIVILLPYPVYLGIDLPNKPAIAAAIPKWFFPSRMLWFSLGIVIGFNLEQFKLFLSRYKGIFLVSTVVFLILGVIEWEVFFRLSGLEWLSTRETIIDVLYSLALLLSFIAYQQAPMPFSKGINQLGKDSYGIYLTHAIFVEYSARVIFHVAPWLLGYQIILLPLLFIIGLGGPVLMMAVVDRSPAKRFRAYLFG
jgi:peptidoglycan/LPS O-acetylase OafA/YrhL